MNSRDEDARRNEALFGPAAKFSDHKPGETIRFMHAGQEVAGLITWVAAPGQTASGKHTPLTYICSVEGELMPIHVYETDILR